MSIKPPKKTSNLSDFGDGASRGIPKNAEKASQVSVNSKMEKQIVNKGTPNSFFLNPPKSKKSSPKK